MIHRLARLSPFASRLSPPPCASDLTSRGRGASGLSPFPATLLLAIIILYISPNLSQPGRGSHAVCARQPTSGRKVPEREFWILLAARHSFPLPSILSVRYGWNGRLLVEARRLLRFRPRRLGLLAFDRPAECRPLSDLSSDLLPIRFVT